MAGYRMKVISIDGDTSLSEDGADYRVYFDHDGDPLATAEMEPIVAAVARRHPVAVGATPQAKTFPVKIECRDLDQTKIDALKRKLSPWDDRLKYVVVEDGSGVQRRLQVLTLGVIDDEDAEGIVFQCILHAPRAVWESVNLNAAATVTVDQNIENFTWNNAGSAPVRPKVTITPVDPKRNAAGALTKERFIVVANRAGVPLVDARGNPYPIEITAGGWNIQSLLDAGSMHPQGYDVWVYVNGVPAHRYLANWGAGYGPVSGNAVNAASELQSYHDGAAARHAQVFVLPGCSEKETNTVDRVSLWMQTVGSPTGNQAIQIRADNNGRPGSVVATSQNVAIGAGVIDSTLRRVNFTFAANPVLNARTKYWIEVLPPTGTNNVSSYVQLASTIATATYEGFTYPFAHSADGTTWYAGYTELTTTAGHSGIINNVARAIDFRVRVTGNAKIWVPMELPSAVQLTTRDALVQAAATLVIADEEGHQRLPESGMLVIEDATTGHECIKYTSKSSDGRTLSIAKGRRGTSDVEHASGKRVFLVDVDVRLLFGDPSATVAPTGMEPLGANPVIDGVNSTNEQLRYIGPYLAFDELLRPLAARAEYDDSVALATQVSLDNDPANDDTRIEFRDKAPEGSYGKQNTVRFAFPTGIEAAGNAITMDVTPIPIGMALEVLGRTSNGEIATLATYRLQDAGTGKQITPTDEISQLILRATNETVVGADASGTDTLVTAADPYAQTFELSEETSVRALAFRLKRTSGTDSIAVDLYRVNDDGSVDTRTKLMPTQSQSSLTSSYAAYVFNLASAIKLAAGRYAFAFTCSGSTGVYIDTSAGSTYAGGELRSGGQRTIAINATYDAITDAATVIANGTSLTIGRLAGIAYRGSFRFPLDLLPVGAQVADAKLKVQVTGADADAYEIWPYDNRTAPGQDDPSGDTAAEMFSSCGNYSGGGTAYASGGLFTATGLLTIGLASAANSDIEDAKAAVNRLALGIKKANEGSGSITQIASIEHASNPEAQLLITYSDADEAAFTTVVGRDAWFRVYGSPATSANVAPSGDPLDIDTLVVNLDDVTPATPLVLFQGAEHDVYMLHNDELQNVTTGQSVKIRCPLHQATADTLTIDFDTLEVTNTDPDLAETSYPVALTTFDKRDPMRLNPGDNTMSYTARGAASASDRCTVDPEYRDQWA